jgi:uncharacterized protein (DUF1015 family)
MAEIRPFRGVHYNTDQVSDLTQVICPPYDIISPQQQEDLYQKSEYNFIRIELNKETPQDNSQDNRYTRAASTISQWLRQGILKMDSAPGFYLHTHHFLCLGKPSKRRNLMACVRLEEWDRKVIRPHENIIPRAKSDRMNMLRACQVNTSEVLAMYTDTSRKIASFLENQEKQDPDQDFVDSVGERHQVWAITQPDVIQQIRQIISDQPLYIADGHHRYDSALTCRRERAAQSKVSGEEGFNFVMMSLIDTGDPGVVILPTHRLLRTLSNDVLNHFKSRLRDFFDVQTLSLSQPYVL